MNMEVSLFLTGRVRGPAVSRLSLGDVGHSVTAPCSELLCESSLEIHYYPTFSIWFGG